MELFNQKDIENLIIEILFCLEDKNAIPNFLNQESFLRAEREIEENERTVNDLYLLYSKKLDLTKNFKEKSFKDEREYNYFVSEFEFLTQKLKSIKSSLEEIKDLITNTVLDTSEEGFKYGFLAHKELNKSLNI